MAIFLKGCFYDEVNNTLEAVWLQEVIDPATGAVIEYIPVKRRNYSASQKSDFLADVGTLGQKYIVMAGW